MIIFLSCVKTKANHRCKAEDMYISPLFRYSLQYAKSLNPRRIFILSAKYGLLELNDIIDPYELTLNHMSEKERKRWAYDVCMELQRKNVDYDEKAVFLCGTNYRKYLMQKFPNHEVPLEGMGMGKQLRFLSRKSKI